MEMQNLYKKARKIVRETDRRATSSESQCEIDIASLC